MNLVIVSRVCICDYGMNKVHTVHIEQDREQDIVINKRLNKVRYIHSTTHTPTHEHTYIIYVHAPARE